MEAAHSITWRPLGQVLVEQGLLTGAELEHALAKQQETGKRLGETIVACGFVSGPELATALAAQYGIELTTEKGFGTGLRSEIQRRHETDRRKVHLTAVAEPEHEPEPDDQQASGDAMLLAQLEEQWAKLAAAQAALADRERRLERRRAQVLRFVRRVRERDGLLEHRRRDLQHLLEANEGLRAQVEELRREPSPPPDAPVPESHLVFVQLEGRYALVQREGPAPLASTVLTLPDVDDGVFVVAGSRRSPLPGDGRPCVFAQRA